MTWHPRIVLPLVIGLLLSGAAPAQFLKIGPVEGFLTFDVELTLTSNVEQQPDSSYDDRGVDPEDIYLTYGFDFRLATTLLRDMDLELSLDLEREQHFLREDLNDRTDDPLEGLADLDFDLTHEAGHFSYGGLVTYEADTEWEDFDAFFPGGRTSVVNDVVQTLEAEVYLDWTRDKWSLLNSYTWIWERHREDFEEGDRDEEEWDGELRYDFNRYLDFYYEVTRREVDVIRDQQPPSIDTTRDLGVEFDFSEALDIPHPKITFDLEYRRERQDGVDQEDDWVVGVAVEDLLKFNISRVEVSLSIDWEREQDPEGDEIDLEYEARLAHQLNRFMFHSLEATRQPGNQFGVSEPVDRSDITYTFTWDDCVIRDLRFEYEYNWRREEPNEPGFETVENSDWNISVDFSNPVMIAQGVTAQYTYEYTNDSVSDDFDEHELVIMWTHEL